MKYLSAMPHRFRSALLALMLLVASSASAWAQNAVLTGKVTSEAGDPLAGATVTIPALNITAATNPAGNYTLTVPGERVRGQTVDVVVRFIGYRPSTSTLVLKAGPLTVNAQLKQDVNKIEEIVTVGVSEGTEKVKLPFSVAVINSDELPVPAVNPLAQLQGRVAGARIVQASGRPGSAPSVQLRGPTSLNAAGRGQGPLYVLDGIIINGDLPDFNALDIETIEVVKGASAAALYGARAGAGVITIKTKSGSRGAQDQVKTDIRSEYGFSGLVRQIELSQRTALLKDETGRFCVNVTGQVACGRSIDYLAEQLRINEQGGVFALAPPTFPIDPNSAISGPVLRQRFQIEQWGVPTYNAVQQLAKPQPFSQTNIGVSGKFGKTNVFASGSFLDQGGTIRFLNGLQRTTGRLNIGQQFTDKFRADFTSSYSRSVQDGLNQEGGGAAFFRLTRVPAVVNLLREDAFGRLLIRPNLQAGGQQNENPLYSLQNTLRGDKTDRFVGSVSTRYTPTSWLDVTGQFGYDKSAIAFEQINDKGFRTTVNNPGVNNGFIFQGQANGSSLNGSVDVNARTTVSTDLKLRGGLRYQYDQQDFDTRSLQGNTLAVGGVDAASNITANQAVASSRSSIRSISYIASGTADFKDRYIVDGVIRREGSSLFGPDERYQTFGRGAVAWRVSQESWWPLASVIDEFKVRAAYGVAGGRPAFSGQYETFSINTGGILFPALLGNRNLKPEVSKEREIGIEAQLFGSIGLEVNFVTANTTNQLLPVPLSQAQGFGTQVQNAGTLLNRTTEIAINVPVITSKDMDLRLRGTFDRNRTYITELGVAPYNYGSPLQATTAMFQAREGERLGAFYGREFLTSCSQLPSSFQADCGGATSAFQVNDDGWLVWVGSGNSWQDGITKNLWQTQLPGSASPYAGIALNWGMPIILRDETGGAVQSPLGNALPDFNFSISQDFRYKRLSISALLQSSIGQSVYNQGRHWSYLDFNARDLDQTNKTVGTAKPIGYYYRAAPPDATAGIGGLYDILAPNNAFVEDASFAKLREVSIGYQIGRVLGAGNWNATVIGRNLFTITNYTGFDPEVGIGGGAAASSGINAVDAFTFPNPRTVTFALQTSF